MFHFFDKTRKARVLMLDSSLDILGRKYCARLVTQSLRAEVKPTLIPSQYRIYTLILSQKLCIIHF
jgi:hypothetical protein